MRKLICLLLSALMALMLWSCNPPGDAISADNSIISNNETSYDNEISVDEESCLNEQDEVNRDEESSLNEQDEVNRDEESSLNEQDEVNRDEESSLGEPNEAHRNEGFSLEDIPSFTENPSVEINDNVPYFHDSELTTTAFKRFPALDELGRCGVAMACLGPETIPTVERESIGMIQPSGWHTVKYEGIDGNYLYNRCHLIGYQLCGENANELNLITGTRFLNVQGMEPYETETAYYIERTGNHVLYRVTPIFKGDDLLATGVLMEAKSVEDDDYSFCVFCYNVQPGIKIDYATGENSEESFELKMSGEATGETPNRTTQIADDQQSDTQMESNSSGGSQEQGGFVQNANEQEQQISAQNSVSQDGMPSDDQQQPDYILNLNSHKFHYPDCKSVEDMAEHNKKAFYGTREEAIAQGYDPCGNCKP